MPIYEYRCQDCAQVSSFFTRAIGDPLTTVCGQCQGGNMVRQFSSFAVGRSGNRSGRETGPSAGGPGLDYYHDPRNIGRNVEESYVQHGLNMPDAVRETIDSARDGKLPKGLDI